MAEAQLIELADAIVAGLNAHSFSQPFAAERKYLPLFDDTELATLKVIVVPKSEDSDLLTRGKTQDDLKCDIGLLKQINPDDLHGSMDPLLKLCEEIRDFLKLKIYANATWIRNEHPQLWSPERLLKERVFQSVITVTFRSAVSLS
jgi:hypothetical protein